MEPLTPAGYTTEAAYLCWVAADYRVYLNNALDWFFRGYFLNRPLLPRPPDYSDVGKFPEILKFPRNRITNELLNFEGASRWINDRFRVLKDLSVVRPLLNNISLINRGLRPERVPPPPRFEEAAARAPGSKHTPFVQHVFWEHVDDLNRRPFVPSPPLEAPSVDYVNPPSAAPITEPWDREISNDPRKRKLAYANVAFRYFSTYYQLLTFHMLLNDVSFSFRSFRAYLKASGIPDFAIREAILFLELPEFFSRPKTALLSIRVSQGRTVVTKFRKCAANVGAKLGVLEPSPPRETPKNPPTAPAGRNYPRALSEPPDLFSQDSFLGQALLEGNDSDLFDFSDMRLESDSEYLEGNVFGDDPDFYN